MCGRFALYSEKKIFSKFNIKVSKNFNISPGQNVLIIDNYQNLKIMKWGIKPNWKKTIIINARNESLTTKKTFLNLNRCVFIADGYYEWKRTNQIKIPYYHHLKEDLLFFAGIYDDSGCCIVTKESCAYLSEIHSRQPFFLRENQIESWVNKKDKDLCFDDLVLFHPVSQQVNRIWNNTSDLILEDKNYIDNFIFKMK